MYVSVVECAIMYEYIAILSFMLLCIMLCHVIVIVFDIAVIVVGVVVVDYVDDV